MVREGFLEEGRFKLRMKNDKSQSCEDGREGVTGRKKGTSQRLRPKKPKVAEMRDQGQSKERDTQVGVGGHSQGKLLLRVYYCPCPPKMLLCDGISPSGYQPVLYGFGNKMMLLC